MVAMDKSLRPYKNETWVVSLGVTNPEITCLDFGLLARPYRPDLVELLESIALTLARDSLKTLLLKHNLYVICRCFA